MRPLKVTLSVHHFPPSYLAGVELLVMNYARWLVAHGNTVEVVCVEGIDAERHLQHVTERVDGLTVHRLGLRLAGTDEHLGLRFRDPAVYAWFADYFKRSRPDIFHSQSSYLLTASQIEAAKDAGIPTLVSLHDQWYFCPRINLLRSDGRRCTEPVTPTECARCIMGERRRYRLLDRGLRRLGRGSGESSPNQTILEHWPADPRLVTRIQDRHAYLKRMLASADKVVILAPFARQMLARHGYRLDHVRMVPSGLDPRGWRHLPHRPRREALQIGYLGQVAPHKGVHVLIQAFQSLPATVAPPNLRIHGDTTRFPRYVAELRAMTRGNGRIQFMGSYDNGDVEALLQDIDVLVVPSVVFETRPLVIMEAFATGVPVIASRLPNLEYQIRDGVDGLLFEPESPRDLSCRLQQVIERPELLDALSAGIPAMRTVDEEMCEIEQLYFEVLDRHAGGTVRMAREAS